ncbi:MAG TPA: hypothetical protein VF497_13905 [Rudaea sp.]
MIVIRGVGGVGATRFFIGGCGNAGSGLISSGGLTQTGGSLGVALLMRCSCIATGGTSSSNASMRCSEKLPDHAEIRGKLRESERRGNADDGTEPRANAVMTDSFDVARRPATSRRIDHREDYASKCGGNGASRFS